MDRSLAALSGILFLVAAAACWVFLPFWVSVIFIPALAWLGSLLIVEGVRTPVRTPDNRTPVASGKVAQPQSPPKDSRRLAA